MKKLLLALIFVFSSLLIAQGVDSTVVEEQKAPETTNPTTKENKWYYGGTVGFNFWSDYFYLSVNPLVGYKVSPKFSVGGKINIRIYKRSKI